MDFSEDFVELYNEALAQLGCDVRVALPSNPWHSGALRVTDKIGNEIGHLPDTIEPIEMAAVAALLRKRFDQGIELGIAQSTRAAI